MSESPIHGSCLCGKVTFEVGPPFLRMVHCHCSRCRKSTGAGHGTNLITDPAGFKWLTGEALISHYDVPDAKSYGKWFCSHCGCPVPRATRDGSRMVVPAGSLDDVPPLKPSDNIFWGSRAPWGCADNGLPTHDEYPDSW